MPGMVKQPPRLIFKSVLSYANKGCFARCNDLVRLTVRFETLDALAAGLQALLDSKELWVVRHKNRFDPSLDLAMTGGYMDYQLLVVFKSGLNFAVGEIQLNHESCIDIKEGVAANGGGGHGPYKLARSFNGYSPETVVYNGAPSMSLVKKIETGMLLSVSFAEGSEKGLSNLSAVGAAAGKAFASKQCRVQTLDFGGNGAFADSVLSAWKGLRLATSLASLNLEMCRELTMLPESIGQLINLQSLNLSGDYRNSVNLTMLPESIGQLTNLQSLNLKWCKELTMLPEWIGQLTNLQSLDLSNCGELKEPLPDLSHLLPTLKIEGVYHTSDATKAWEKRGYTAAP